MKSVNAERPVVRSIAWLDFFVVQRIVLLICSIRVVIEVFRASCTARRVGVKYALVDPLCYLAHHGVHPRDVVRHNAWSGRAAPLLGNALANVLGAAKRSIIGRDHNRASAELPVKCGVVTHSVWESNENKMSDGG